MYEYFDEMCGDSLQHHGILGMRWGIRRFQNYDGTLKTAGKKRYKTDDGSEEKPKMTRAEKKAAKTEAKAAKEKADLEEAKKKAIATANVDDIIKLSSKMTTEELRDAMTRVTAISTMNKNKLPKEKTAFDKAVSVLGKVKTGADAVKNAHQSIRQLREEFGLDTKSLVEKAEAESKSSDGDKNQNGKKDAADKAFDLYSKFKADREKKKFQTELTSLRNREKNNKTLEWLKSVSGSDKSDSKPSPSSSLPKANFSSPFKLKDGDYGVFKTTPVSTASSSISKKTSSFFSNNVKKGTSLGDTSIESATKSLLGNNQKALDDYSERKYHYW